MPAIVSSRQRGERRVSEWAGEEICYKPGLLRPRPDHLQAVGGGGGGGLPETQSSAPLLPPPSDWLRAGIPAADWLASRPAPVTRYCTPRPRERSRLSGAARCRQSDRGALLCLQSWRIHPSIELIPVNRFTIDIQLRIPFKKEISTTHSFSQKNLNFENNSAAAELSLATSIQL